MIIWTLIYIVLNISCGFINRSLEGGRQIESTKNARFFAGIIYINFALTIMFMCLVSVTFISGFGLMRKYLPLGDTKFYHYVCAGIFCLATLVHILIHIFGDFPLIARRCARQPKKAYVTVSWLIFWNLTGMTGVISTLLFLGVVIPPLIPYIRQKKYEIFLHMHKLVYLGLISTVLHCETPDTERYTWVVFMFLPCVLLTLELCFRGIRYYTNKTKILRVKYLPSGVVFLEVKKPKGFNYKCGQYAQLNIPCIDKWQFHPFTFASSPKDDSLYFYINPAGDWTNGLKTLGSDNSSNSGNRDESSARNDFLLADKDDVVVHVDGPFGAPAEFFNSYDDVIFIASGVGVTPFSSILISILYQMKRNQGLKHKSVSFFWIQREYSKTDYINNILRELSHEDRDKLIEINVFITGAQQKFDLR